jgi:predicted nuclease with TOPRIM domain
MKLSSNDIDRLNALIADNPTLKGQMEKLIQLWSLVDSEYVSIKSELDQVNSQLKTLINEKYKLEKRRRALGNKLSNMTQCDKDDIGVEDYDDEEKEKDDGDDSL